MRNKTLIGAAALVATLGLSATAAAAQDVTYRYRSDFKTGGAMDKIMAFAGKMGGEDANARTQFVKGLRMRTDEGPGSSTIVDLEAKRMYLLQHDDKTYLSIPLDSLAAGMQAMAEAMQGAEPETDGQTAAEEPTLEFNVSLDRTGERETIAGYPAEQVFLTLEAEPTEAALAEMEEDDSPTRLVLLMETWQSTDVPGYETLQRFQEEMGSQMLGGGGEGLGGAVMGLFTGTPGTKQALERAGEEMKKLEGMPLRSATYVITVPLEREFERSVVLDPPEEKGGVDVKKAASSMLGGLFGKKQQEEEEPEEDPAPVQKTVLTMTDTLTEVDTSSLPADLFQVPADYTEIEGDPGDEG